MYRRRKFIHDQVLHNSPKEEFRSQFDNVVETQCFDL